MKKLLALLSIVAFISLTANAQIAKPVKSSTEQTDASKSVRKKGTVVNSGIVQKSAPAPKSTTASAPAATKSCCQKANASCCKMNTANKACTADQKAACAKAGKECSHKEEANATKESAPAAK